VPAGRSAWSEDGVEPRLERVEGFVVEVEVSDLDPDRVGIVTQQAGEFGGEVEDQGGEVLGGDQRGGGCPTRLVAARMRCAPSSARSTASRVASASATTSS
jgi:hypothetical protein